MDTTSCIEDIEIVLCLDDDDVESQKISNDKLLIKKVISPRGLSMGKLNIACFNASSGQYVMLLNDDVILRTKNWDKIISSLLSLYPDDIVLIHTNDLLFREKLCTFPMLSRRACQEIGVCSPEYQRYRIDDHIYDIYNMLAYLGHKRIVFLPEVIFEHDNYTQGIQGNTGQIFKSEENKIYKPNQEILESDARIFDGKQEERKNDALKLVKLIEEMDYEKNRDNYQQMLNKINDPFSYRKTDFIRKIENNQLDIRLKPSVTVAVVTSDIRKEHPIKCLALIKKHTSDYDLIILDNNNSKQFNHPTEMNKVLRIVKTDFLVLMDDDVFVEEGWLDGLLKSFNENTGVVTPMFKDGKGAISYSGVYLAGDGRGTHAHLLDKFDEPRVIQCLCSALIMIDMKKCKGIFFNPSYKKYFLDLDYALQVWDAGYEVICTPYTIVTHLAGATMPYSSKNSRILVKRDEEIFIDIWVKSGRITKIETEVWSCYPFLLSIMNIPQNIIKFFNNADDLEVEKFKVQLETLTEKIAPLKLFHSQMITQLQQYISSCNLKGDVTRAQICEEMIKKIIIGSTQHKIVGPYWYKIRNIWWKGMMGLYKKKHCSPILKKIDDTEIKKNNTQNKESHHKPAPILMESDYLGFKIFLFDSRYFAILKDDGDFNIDCIKMNNYQKCLVALSLEEIKGEINIIGGETILSPEKDYNERVLFICNVPPLTITHLTHDFEKHEISFLVPKEYGNLPKSNCIIKYLDAHGKESCNFDITDIYQHLLQDLIRKKFDLVIIPFEGSDFWKGTGLELLAAAISNRIMIIFPNGKKRLYKGEDIRRIQYNKAYLNSMFRFLPKLTSKKLLEIGCSDGFACDLLLSENPEKIIGIDTLEIVGCNYQDSKIEYIKMDASQLLFENHSFDLCFSIATLEHCKDPFSVLQEMKRVTKKGGYCYVQAGPLYFSPFGHHMFGYFDDYPWIHLRMSKEQIIAYARQHNVDEKILKNLGIDAENYVFGMLNVDHINGKKFDDYQLEKFMSLPDIEVLNFSRSYEGKNLLSSKIKDELKHINEDDLISHGFELVFRVK